MADEKLLRAIEKLTYAVDGMNPNKQSRLKIWADMDKEKRDKRITPAGLRWMVFVDGENLAIRFQAKAHQEFGKSAVTSITPEHFLEDVFVWPPVLVAVPGMLAHLMYKEFVIRPEPVAINYYTTATGDRDRIKEIEDKLWRQKLRPVVFSKPSRERKTKGVDITLTRDLLTQAFLDTYDLAVIFSGDADFVPVIEELRRLGKSVMLFAFKDYLPRDLRIACNAYFDAWDLFKGYCADSPQKSEDPDSEISWMPVSSRKKSKPKSTLPKWAEEMSRYPTLET